MCEQIVDLMQSEYNIGLSFVGVQRMIIVGVKLLERRRCQRL